MTRTIVISGAGSGIGRAIAQDLAREIPDSSLVLIGRRADALEQTRKSLLRPDAHQVLAVAQNNHATLHRALAKLDLPARNLVGVVANAGVGGENRYGPGDRWEEIINTNLTGTYYLINELMPALKASNDKPCNIVITSSILARMGVPGYTAYCASKAGLLGLMRSLAAAHARDQIFVNAICPGWVNTEMAKQGIKLLAGHTGQSYEDALKEQLDMVPTRKMSEPAEIASLVTYIMGNKQSSFTGQCFDMNNGAMMP